MSKYAGDLYVFDINIPEYISIDDTTRYGHKVRDDCSNNKTMKLGTLTVLAHKSNGIKEFITTIDYEDRKKWLNTLK